MDRVNEPPGNSDWSGVWRIADEAIGLFIEYRDQHGFDEDAARRQAVADVTEGACADVD